MKVTQGSEHLKQNVWHCVKVLGLWHMTVVSTCCSRPWLSLSSTSFFIFYTPAVIHWPWESTPHPYHLPYLASPRVRIKILEILPVALSQNSINCAGSKLIILSNFPVSEDALFVLVPFCRIKDQYYRIPRWAHQVFFFFLKSSLQSLFLCWNRNCLTSPLKSPTSLVFFIKSCLADRD